MRSLFLNIKAQMTSENCHLEKNDSPFKILLYSAYTCFDVRLEWDNISLNLKLDFFLF